MQNNKLQICLPLILASLLALGPKASEAVSLIFEPVDQSVNVGQQAQVDVLASDLAGDLIGAFDFFVNFDPAILALDTVVFGSALGGPLDSIQDSVESTAGSVNIAELSLVADLSTLQDGVSDVLLFSISFDTISVGSSTLSFSENILGLAGGFLSDESGEGIALDTMGTGNITVSETTVPLPGSLTLLTIGIAGASIRRIRKNRV